MKTACFATVFLAGLFSASSLLARDGRSQHPISAVPETALKNVVDDHVAALATANSSISSSITGLVAWYSFDNPADLGEDSSGNDHHGVNNYGVAYDARGMVGGCACCSGNIEYVEVPDHADLSLTNLTVTFWLKTPTEGYQGGQNRILAKWRLEGHSEGWWGHLRQNDGIRLGVGDGTIGHAHEVYTENVGRTNWVHVALVISPRISAIYTNGFLATSTNWLVDRALLTDVDLRIGAYNSAGWAGLKGWLDEVKIWGRTLTDAEILYEARLIDTQHVDEVTILTETLPGGVVDIFYESCLAVTGGTPPIRVDLVFRATSFRRATV